MIGTTNPERWGKHVGRVKIYLKYFSYGLLGILGLLFIGYGLASLRVYYRTTIQYHVPVREPSVKPTDELVERGRHVARIRGCRDCHGRNFAGKTFIDQPLMGHYAGSNLTSGEGGIGNEYDTEDWTRAIRHGLDPDGYPLIFMPSFEYDELGNQDMAALIAFLESLSPVDNRPTDIRIGPMSKFLYLSGNLPQLLSAEIIDHDRPRTPPPDPGATVAYGRYVATSCTGCHGQDLSGGPIPGVPPDWPEAPNLTPHSTGLADWSFSEFETVMRTGRTPSGRRVKSQYMPWKNFRHMSDTETEAVWTYLQSLEPRP